QIIVGFVFGSALLAQTVNLGKTGNTRFAAESQTLPVRVSLDSLLALRPRTNQAHVSANHVPQLGKFGDAQHLQQPLPQRKAQSSALAVETVHAELMPVLSATQVGDERLPPSHSQPEHTGQKQRRRYHQQN